jgi:hypothetical protein
LGLGAWSLGLGAWSVHNSLRGAEEKKKNDVPNYLPFLRFSEIFRSDFRKYFYGVFYSCRETAKSAIKKNRWEKTKGKKKNLNFFGQKLLTWTPPF